MPGQKYGPAWFPGLIAAGLIACGVLLAVRARKSPWIEMPDWLRRPQPLAGVASVIAGLLFYIFAAQALGFYLTGILILLLWSRILGAPWKAAVPVSVLATAAIHLSFYKLLRIPLPWGIFERWAF
jgi:putative tricarboxylic transport membrane protein